MLEKLEMDISHKTGDISLKYKVQIDTNKPKYLT
jgi:hypothetical protein